MNIGVFDSGLGGLTVVKALSQVMKNAKLFYIADTHNAPYGEKTPQEILNYSLKITEYLIEKYEIDALVLACNTATAFAIKHLREVYPDLIIIGTEPGVKPAIEKTKTGNIGVLATPATLKGDKYQNLVTHISKEKDVRVFEQACPGLVEQIESGKSSSESCKVLLENWLKPMREARVDTIVLGCTHYPLVGAEITEIMACEVVLIDTGLAIAKRLLALGLSQGHENEGDFEIFVQSTGEIHQNLVEDILETPVCIQDLTLN
ncbi:MAG: glutamate racemase [Sulfurovum sp.]|nr:glutamate racemase [Sulfurovum sp.]